MRAGLGAEQVHLFREARFVADESDDISAGVELPECISKSRGLGNRLFAGRQVGHVPRDGFLTGGKRKQERSFGFLKGGVAETPGSRRAKRSRRVRQDTSRYISNTINGNGVLRRVSGNQRGADNHEIGAG